MNIICDIELNTNLLDCPKRNIEMKTDKAASTVIADIDIQTGVRYRELVVLRQVSAALRGLSDLDANLGVALENVLSIMKAGIGGILLLNEENQTLPYRVYRDSEFILSINDDGQGFSISKITDIEESGRR